MKIDQHYAGKVRGQIMEREKEANRKVQEAEKQPLWNCRGVLVKRLSIRRDRENRLN